jgi:hypothetical protein
MERGRPRVPAPPVIITVRFLKDWGLAKGVEVALDILEIKTRFNAWNGIGKAKYEFGVKVVEE